MTKMTYAMALETVIATLNDGEVKEKLIALKHSVEKKNSAEKKLTATQKENESLKVAIYDAMVEGEKYTVTDLIKSVSALAELTNQRVSALVRQLKDDGFVEREEIKRKAYFTKVVKDGPQYLDREITV